MHQTSSHEKLRRFLEMTGFLSSLDLLNLILNRKISVRSCDFLSERDFIAREARDMERYRYYRIGVPITGCHHWYSDLPPYFTVEHVRTRNFSKRDRSFKLFKLCEYARTWRVEITRNSISKIAIRIGIWSWNQASKDIVSILAFFAFFPFPHLTSSHSRVTIHVNSRWLTRVVEAMTGRYHRMLRSRVKLKKQTSSIRHYRD